MLKLGVHVSIAGGIHKSIDRAFSLGCNTMQIFARNPRRFRKGFLCKEDIENFRKKVKASAIKPVVIHAPYTLNLAASKKFLHWITIKEFILDLVEADKIGAQYLVTHTGSHKGVSEDKGLKKVVKAFKKILKTTESLKTRILIENTSGTKNQLGYTFSHYRFILKELDFTPKLGVCLDTAHTWSAGYEINRKEGLDDFLKMVDKTVGIKRVKVIHLNDTREELGSGKDRHCHIGEGKIGINGFALIVNHPLLKKLPFILETPRDEKTDDLRNLAIIRRLYQDEL
ncbi:MAG: deoxyribonuclease IV [Candidatus Omnitrophica bacterium]|nr:deoxyribonuclease IV [Candidatus Omnitrophota bacterium]